jgi:hypothetical protein
MGRFAQKVKYKKYFINVKFLGWYPPKNQPQITQINQNPQKKISQATKKFHELQYCTKPKNK